MQQVLPALSLLFFTVCCRALACGSRVWHKMHSGVPLVTSCLVRIRTQLIHQLWERFCSHLPRFSRQNINFCSVRVVFFGLLVVPSIPCIRLPLESNFPALNQRFIFKRSCMGLQAAFLTTHLGVLFCGNRQIQELLSRCKPVFRKIGCMNVKSV